MLVSELGALFALPLALPLSLPLAPCPTQPSQGPTFVASPLCIYHPPSVYLTPNPIRPLCSCASPPPSSMPSAPLFCFVALPCLPHSPSHLHLLASVSGEDPSEQHGLLANWGDQRGIEIKILEPGSFLSYSSVSDGTWFSLPALQSVRSASRIPYDSLLTVAALFWTPIPNSLVTASPPLLGQRPLQITLLPFG